jgi:hypothetical protein
MSPSPPRKQPDGSAHVGDPRRVGHDTQRDADDGIERGRQPSDHDLRQPNERDASADGEPTREVDPVVRQAERDIASGRVDTDVRGKAVPNFERARRASSKKPSGGRK